MATNKTKPLSPAFIAEQFEPIGEKAISATIQFRVDAAIKKVVIDHVDNPSEYYRQLIENDVRGRGWLKPD